MASKFQYITTPFLYSSAYLGIVFGILFFVVVVVVLHVANNFNSNLDVVKGRCNYFVKI